jgi:hypothetical protein
MSCQSNPAVAVIGAGPYGLSIAAHLRSRGVEFRIFGAPMHGRRAHMPKGMFLKSEGCASNLFDPAGYTLRQYCADEGLRYAQYGLPVSLDVFTQYGLSFQQRLVPSVENAMIVALDRSPVAFELRLATGERLTAGKVVIATGMSYTAYVPVALRRLPLELFSHSSSHHDLSGFTGRDITVIGGGQSALETAALLHEVGAQVRLLVRRSSVLWNVSPVSGRRSVYERLRRPMSNLGPGFGPWLYSNAPMLFCYLPRQIRTARVQKALGPAGASWLRERVEGRLPVMTGHSVRAAGICRGQALLHVQGPDGNLSELTTDHVIAATGYRFSLRALPFLSKHLSSKVRCIQNTPVLSSNFESSVLGLYFTGLASANQFGPAMRFLHGADYTARRLAGHIAGSTHRFPLPFSAMSGRVQTCEDG